MGKRKRRHRGERPPPRRGATMYVVKGCWRKVRYAAAELAEPARADLEQEHGRGTTYACPACGGYHVTKVIQLGEGAA